MQHVVPTRPAKRPRLSQAQIVKIRRERRRPLSDDDSVVLEQPGAFRCPISTLGDGTVPLRRGATVIDVSDVPQDDIDSHAAYASSIVLVVEFDVSCLPVEAQCGSRCKQLLLCHFRSLVFDMAGELRN